MQLLMAFSTEPSKEWQNLEIQIREKKTKQTEASKGICFFSRVSTDADERRKFTGKRHYQEPLAQ